MGNSIEYMREYRNNNRERLQKKSSERREKWRLEFLELIGGSKCKDCGNTDVRVLQFDHLHSKERNVSYWLNRNRAKALQEAEKCDVVCANCHNIGTYERRKNGITNKPV